MVDAIEKLKAHKNQDTALVCLTAYTAPMAQSLAPYVDVLLVGDSLGMTLYGMDSTLGVDLDMMIRHGAAVKRGVEKSNARPVVVVDMPAGSYEDSPEQALGNARRIMDDSGADAVKLEGGATMAAQIQAITQAGIPVMGHIGLQPQSVIKEGGFKIKGKTPEQINTLLADAKAVEAAGAFSFVIEGTIDTVSEMLTVAVNIPTVGIGASAACDGQILVSEDMLGLLYGHTPKFAKKYAHLNTQIEEAVKAYADDVRARVFPSQDYLYKAS